jgi:hypothetical protein
MVLQLRGAIGTTDHTLDYQSHEYVGQVRGDAQMGHGTFSCIKSGDSYAGEYQGNRMHGIGVHMWADGDAYQGQYKAGVKEGYGVFQWASGAKYCGEWRTNRREGYGVDTSEEDRTVYRGQFKGDEREGHGVIEWPNGHFYRGQLKGGEMDGHGVFFFPSGEQTFELYRGGKEISSVPFNKADPAHARVLQIANEAEVRATARRTGLGGKHSQLT